MKRRWNIEELVEHFILVGEDVPTPGNNTQDRDTGKTRISLIGLIRSPFWICLLIGILVRLLFVLHTLPTLAGDEANPGLQAENILRGQHFVYYYDQPYMGSLEAYILALFFAIAGPSTLVLRIGMLCTSLVLVCLTWCFGSALADQARLTGRVKITFVVIATLLSALAPLYDTVLELRSWGGYVEAMIIMLWLLHTALRLTQRWSMRATRRELALRWLWLGFLVGVGLWIDPLVIYGIIAAALWIGWHILSNFVHPGSTLLPHPRRTLIMETLLVIVTIPAALLGFAPAIDYGLKRNWSNIVYMLHNGKSSYGSTYAATPMKRIVTIYARCVAPRVIGGSLPTDPFVTQYHPGVLTPGLVINLLCIGLAVTAIVLSFFWRIPILERVRQLTILPLIFMLITSIVYCMSSIVAKEIEITGCGQSDLTGRYAAPLVIALPFFLAAIFTCIWYFKSPQARIVADVSDTPQLYKSKNTFIFSIRLLLLAILAIYFSTQLSAYAAASSTNTFKNPGCTKAPTDNTEIIKYMQQIHLSYAFATGWIGDPLTFEANESIIVTEPPAKARIYDNSIKVLQANHYGFLLFEKTSDTKAYILTLLDKYHYKYSVKRFPTIPGWDVMVISTQKNISLNDPIFGSLLRRQILDQC
jgi:hypothetical protein